MTEKMNRGSEWRVWDLHIHTPDSICQDYNNTDEGWEKFINALANLPKSVKVVGITDYYFIDGYEKVMKAKSEGRLNNLDKIFPILEFRIDTFGSGHQNNLQKLNLHILFDLDESKLGQEIKRVKEEFIGLIKLSPNHQTKALSKENFAEVGGDVKNGFSSLIPSTTEVFKLLNDETWKDKTFILFGYKEWSNIEKNQQLRPIKEHLYSKAQAFLGNNAGKNSDNQKWLDELSTTFKKKRLLHSLDIHDFKSLDTYEYEDEGNLKVTENYHCHTWVKADTTFEGLKQIYYEPEERVSIRPHTSIPEAKSDYQVIDSITINHKLFHEQTLHLNQNLNSIIGGRSTGKSLLLGAIAKKLKPTVEVKSDNDDYNELVSSLADCLTIHWKDDKEQNDREIEYFPQSHMYSLAKPKNEKKLFNIVDGIIRQDADKNQLIVDYKSFSNSNNTTITNGLNKLYELIDNLQESKSQLKEKGDEEGVESEIQKLTKELNELKTQSTITEEELDEYQKLSTEYEKLTKSNERLTSESIKISSLKEKQFFVQDLDVDLISLSEENKTSLKETFQKLKTEFLKSWQEEVEKINGKISSQKDTQIQRTKGIATSEVFTKGEQALRKNSQYTELEKRLKIQNGKLSDIKKIKKEIEEIEKQIESQKTFILRNHKGYYYEILNKTEKLKEQKDKLQITASPKVNTSEFKDLLRRSINQKRYDMQVLVEREIDSPEDFFTACHTLFESLLKEELPLKGGNKSRSLVQEILSTNFFEIAYRIEYENDDFNQMSEGKKAFVILMLLLDFSNKEYPILIDQPEDDLDNRAIYHDLVKYLRKKKKERQIILVTHNPNIVVGADSELVIVANQHGKDSPNTQNVKFQYVSGSLESTFPKNKKIKTLLESQGIKEHVCEILEGGNEAFKQREMKYALK